MLSFEKFFLEYRKLVHGLDLSPHGGNGKGDNITRDISDRKIIHTVGPYKPKNADVHKPGQIFIGDSLLAILAEYNLEFKPNETAQIKNSPNAIFMFINPHGQQAGRIVQTKTAPVK